MQSAEDDDIRRDLIEDNLKRVYDETLEEMVPYRFTDLLERLRRAEDTEMEHNA